MVDGLFGYSGNFTLTITCPSPSALVTDTPTPSPTSTPPPTLSCGVPTFGTTVGQADSVLVNNGLNQGPDVSFIFNASVTGDYTFSLCNGTSYDSMIQVFDLTTATPVGFNDDSCGTASSVTINSLSAVSCQFVVIRLNSIVLVMYI